MCNKNAFILVIWSVAITFSALPVSGQTLTADTDTIPFAPPVSYDVVGDPRGIFCADLDGDMDVDLAVAGYYDNIVSILRNNGDGTFQSAVPYEVGDWPYSVFCADLASRLRQVLLTTGCQFDLIEQEPGQLFV